jgi:hypothetical protein
VAALLPADDSSVSVNQIGKTRLLEIGPQLGMADARRQPGWLLCVKLAIKFRNFDLVRTVQALNIFATCAGAQISNHCAASLYFAIRSSVCEI